jgi:hypothetical protein
MDLFGKTALFAVGEAAVLLVLAVWAAVPSHAWRRKHTPKPHLKVGHTSKDRAAA